MHDTSTVALLILLLYQSQRILPTIPSTLSPSTSHACFACFAQYANLRRSIIDHQQQFLYLHIIYGSHFDLTIHVHVYSCNLFAIYCGYLCSYYASQHKFVDKSMYIFYNLCFSMPGQVSGISTCMHAGRNPIKPS